LGIFLRNRLVHNPNSGNHWATSLLFSLVTDLVPFYDTSNDSLDEEPASKIISSYNSFIDTVIGLNLQHNVDSKPLLNGHGISIAFGVTKTGPWIGRVLEDIVEWQLGHPSGTKDDCLQWLKERGADLYISGDDEKVKSPTKRLRTK